MSMEFCVILKQKVDLTELWRDTQSVLQKMLNLSFRPNIGIKDQKISHNCLGEVGDTVRFEIDALAEANLMVLSLPHDESAPFSNEPTAVISAGSLRTEPSWACVIALVIALAQMTKANIIDDALLLSTSSEVDPTILLDKIMLVERQDDLSQASHELLTRLDIV